MPPLRQEKRPFRAASIPAAIALWSCLWAVSAAHAQAASANAPVSADAASAARQAQHEGDKVFQWIILNSGKTHKPAASAAEAKVESKPEPKARPAPPPRAVAHAKPEPKDRTEAAAAPRPAPAPVAQAPAPNPASVRTAAAPAPAPVQAAAPAPSPAVALASPPPNVPAQQAIDAGAAPAPAPAGAQQASAGDDEDAPLVVLQQVNPNFSPMTMEHLGKGSVDVRFLVAADGTVHQPQVVKTTNSRLNYAVVEAVEKWRFKPLPHAQVGEVQLGFDMRNQ